MSMGVCGVKTDKSGAGLAIFTLAPSKNHPLGGGGGGYNRKSFPVSVA